MIVGMTALALVLVALPHLPRGTPRSAATSLVVWTVALGVRAAGCLLAAVCLIVLLPRTTAFAALTDWCWDAAVPLLAAHVGVLGHEVGDALSLVPFLALNASAFWVAMRIARGARTVRQTLSGTTVGRGPRGTLILGSRQVMLGAAGFLRPRVVVTAGALTTLDDEELDAAIAHERGHIRRGHRFVAAFAELCGAVAAPVPGTRGIVREVHRQIERDADAWAVGRAHAPAALASAICKSALSRAANPALATLTGAGTADRVEELLGDERTALPRPDPVLRIAALLGAGALVAMTAAWAAVIVGGGLSHDAMVALRHACPSCHA